MLLTSLKLKSPACHQAHHHQNQGHWLAAAQASVLPGKLTAARSCQAAIMVLQGRQATLPCPSCQGVRHAVAMEVEVGHMHDLARH